ncbi:asparagine synthase (glutamine-hydrolyzing) [Chryseomicrobium aureum]|uniref:asparagine synthetase B family protein n=1 Tax=Chryseomicrobium aureum TaxID=1441723 RepID=UPI00195EFA30|nr:asparagine synthetase B family protein [Chryseomicrobium aureum]MBM7706102.1 asparagine synthase (glutamine-hydrolyzing) [Chryseomicrobium aureum]
MTFKMDYDFRHPDLRYTVLTDGTVYMRGFFYWKENFVESSTLSDHFTCEDLSNPNLLDEINGEFCLVIIPSEGSPVLVVDKVRTIPLFYKQLTGGWLIKDFLYEEGTQLDECATQQFLHTGYTFHNKTLYQEWQQVPTSHVVILKQDVAIQHRYFSYSNEPSSKTIEELSDEFSKVLHEVFDDAVKRIGNKKVILPLSGGNDSRLLALLLRERLPASQFLSFTYGVKGNEESSVSKKIADSLQIEWKFIEYDETMWKTIYSSEQWEEYVKYALMGGSIPHIQDFPSVVKLSRDFKWDANEVIFMPGHTADMLVGGHIPPELAFSEHLTQLDLEKAIQKKHYRLWQSKPNKTEGLLEDYYQEWSTRTTWTPTLTSLAFDQWNIENRQSKFIVNSLRVYEYFQQSWTLPFWDSRLITFFSKVPVEFKYNKYLYLYTLHKMYPNYFPKPKSTTQTISLNEKFGIFYRPLKWLFHKRNHLQRYFTDPMNWYKIYPSYSDYLKRLAFKREGIRYANPYNVNSFIVQDVLRKIEAGTKR